MESGGVDLSFDKVSVVGASKESFQDLVSGLGLLQTSGRPVGNGEIMLTGSGGGLNVQMRCKESALGSRMYPVHPDPDSDSWNIRLEWNPNKAGRIGAEALAALESDRRITRLDLAMDYPGYALSDYTFTRPRVKTMSVNGWHGLNETVYLGRWGSRRFIRCYDKALEMKLDGEIMRLETVGRYRPGEIPLPDNLLAGLSGSQRVVPLSVTTSEAGLLALYHFAPERLRASSARTQRKARDLAERHSGKLDPDPVEIYAASSRELRGLARDLVNGSVLPVANVYKEES